MKKEITREQFSSKLNIELKRNFINLSEITRIPQSKLLDEAIEDLLKKHNYSTTPQPQQPKPMDIDSSIPIPKPSKPELKEEISIDDNIPESLKLTAQMTSDDMWENNSKSKELSDYDILVKFIGVNASRYNDQLKEINENKLSISNFFNMYYNEASWNEFKKYKERIY